ncbi:MAG: hypothetical protein SWH54_19505 [Thermodesulfobacteriota bacterium]|nr:hypothetical protein [Thermodesulfobacteriota bacterium]
MDLYLMELLVKERQQQILDDFKRIKISRAVNNRKVGIFKKFVLGVSRIFIVIGTCLQKRYRPSIKPAISGHGFCSAKGQRYLIGLAQRPTKK